MRPDAQTVLRGLAKFLAVLVAGTAAGAGIGLALSALTGSGDDEPAASAPPRPTPARTAAPPSTPKPAKTPTPKPPDQGPEVVVQSATLISATTPSGKARKRARVVVKVRVKNRTGAPLEPQTPLLINGPGQLPVDPKAKDFAGPVLEPLPAGADAVGELRFEPAGDLTTRLTQQRRGRLRIGSTTVPLKIKG